MSTAPKQHLFIQADQIPGIEDRLDPLLSWIYAADRTYFNNLLADRDPLAIMDCWMRDRCSEIALPITRVLIASDRIAGGYVAMRGRQALRRRENDIIDLLRRRSDPRCPRLRARMRDLLPLFGSVDAGDLYISKLGVVADFEEAGLRQVILDECVARANDAGFRRLRVDVDESDEAACSLFANNDFEVFDRAYAPSAKLRYLNLVRELRRE